MDPKLIDDARALLKQAVAFEARLLEMFNDQNMTAARRRMAGDAATAFHQTVVQMAGQMAQAVAQLEGYAGPVRDEFERLADGR